MERISVYNRQIIMLLSCCNVSINTCISVYIVANYNFIISHCFLILFIIVCILKK